MLTDTCGPLADRRLTEWFVAENARAEREKDTSHSCRLCDHVITISRQFGAGGHIIATKLVERLGGSWQIWDSQIIEAIAASGKIRAEMVRSMDERVQGWLEQTLSSLSGTPAIAPATYRRHLISVLVALAQQGNKIIIGRGANFVIKHGLNVRLFASSDFCIQQIMQREHLNRDEAVTRIKSVDDQRSEFVHNMFNRDVNSHENYDMLLRIDTMGFDGAVDVILAGYRARQGDPHRTTTASQHGSNR